MTVVVTLPSGLTMTSLFSKLEEIVSDDVSSIAVPLTGKAVSGSMESTDGPETDVVGTWVVKTSSIGSLSLEILDVTEAKVVVVVNSVVSGVTFVARSVVKNVVGSTVVVLEVGSGGQCSYLGQHSPWTYSGSQSNRNLQSARAHVIELPWQ